MDQEITDEFILVVKKIDQKYTVAVDGPRGSQLRAVELPNIMAIRNTHETTMQALAKEGDFALEAVEKLGQDLYQALFPVEIAKCFGQAIGQDGKNGVRLSLAFLDTPDLMDLPWETLYDGRQWLALDPYAPLVRQLSIESSSAFLPRELDGPLQILFVAAAPDSFNSNPVEAVYTTLYKQLKPAIDQNKVFLKRAERASTAGIQAELTKQYDVILFVCHGAPGKIFLESDFSLPGKVMADEVMAKELGDILRQRPPQLVFLISCETGASAGFGQNFAHDLSAAANVPAIVAMQYPISDPHAQSFTSEFFAALVASHRVEVALTNARATLTGGSQVNRDLFSPVIYMRKGVAALFREVEQTTKKQANFGGEAELADVANLPITWFGDSSPEVTAIAGAAAEVGYGMEIKLADDVHGLFSGNFLPALRDKAADLDNDGFVSLEEALLTTWHKLRKNQFQQSPVIVGRHRDLALFRLTPKIKQADEEVAAASKFARALERADSQMLGALDVVLIGIDEYPPPLVQLGGAVNDVLLFTHLLTDQAYLNADEVNFVTLVNKRATRENIQNALDNLVAYAYPNRTILFYFSGLTTHRQVQEDPSSRLTKHLVPFDVTVQENGQVDLGALISIPQIVKELAASKALYKVLIIDS